MGQTCCNYKDKDPHDLDPNGKKPVDRDPALDDIMNAARP
jgi:hypothetical protein